MTQNREPVSLLWTGGWDSTYRLLDLLLVKKREVQPYYVIDSERLSTRLEINRMKQIKRRLFKKNPNTISLLKATVFTEMFDIEQNSAITQSFNRLSEKYHFGSQCEWLARFCSQYGIASMELSFERGVAVTAYQDALKDFLVQTEYGGEICWKVDDKYKGSDMYQIFGYYRFPIFDLTKKDMERISIALSFDELMKLTWFCHKPRRFSMPCGLCVPCVTTIKEGLQRRVPFRSRLRYYLHALPPKIGVFFGGEELAALIRTCSIK